MDYSAYLTSIQDMNRVLINVSIVVILLLAAVLGAIVWNQYKGR